MYNVFSVVVVFFPEISSLNNLIASLEKQSSGVVIINNGSTSSIKDLHFEGLENIHLINLGDNRGIAAAQNIGIKQSLTLGASDVILFDQDSIISHDLIDNLLAARSHALKKGIDVAAIGPNHIDIDTKKGAKFVSTDSKGVNLFSLDNSTEPYKECDFLIASGCLISNDALARVGSMEESLFIDCVDIEWGFRAKKIGLTCICTPKAQMEHKIGDAPLRVFGRDLTTHTPLRHYYFYRNLYSLLKRPYIPFCWKLHAFVKSSLQAVLFSIFLKPRGQHFKCILQGGVHGLVNRSGKYE
ncbi:glycosyltransferase family 2 protein [Vibrio crassostreae]|uniref:glycosyltransferase family 2 protein n=1 Tax=Vibrio crassostreae TaxID=246167 RepID=UPI0010498504|nr:glycosyltransferase family 2 protein [Vibrio crassostreae]TCV12748.1 rhamnosyltransferase [Vibrio crassostreae]